MDIREKFAELSTPKKILIVGGGAVVGLMLIRRTLAGSSGASVSAADYTQSLGTVGGSASGGSSGGDTAIDVEQQTQINQLYDAIDDLTRSFSDTQTTTAEALTMLTRTSVDAQNEASFTTALISTPSIYADQIDDATQYRNVLDNLSTALAGGQIQSSQAATAAQYLAGYGNEGKAAPGVTYTPTETIKADPKLLESEIARTNAVIANRKAAGMDTAKGELWLEILGSGAA